jgi:hypothetical protein
MTLHPLQLPTMAEELVRARRPDDHTTMHASQETQKLQEIMTLVIELEEA